MSEPFIMATQFESKHYFYFSGNIVLTKKIESYNTNVYWSDTNHNSSGVFLSKLVTALQ